MALPPSSVSEASGDGATRTSDQKEQYGSDLFSNIYYLHICLTLFFSLMYPSLFLYCLCASMVLFHYYYVYALVISSQL